MPHVPLPLDGVTPEALWARFPQMPQVIDVCLPEDAERLGRLIPGSRQHPFAQVPVQGPAVVICAQGKKLSQGAAAQLRAAGQEASHLIGGLEAWSAAGLPSLVRPAAPLLVTALEPFAEAALMRWIARRMLPQESRLLTVAGPVVADVADRFGGAEVPDVAAALACFGLEDPVLDRMRGDLPEPLLQGLARLHGAHEAGQIAALPLFDAAYAGARL